MAKAFDPFSRPELLKCTGRYREIAELNKLYHGKQYDGRPNWWTGKTSANQSSEAPLRDRKPCVIYKLPKAAVQQVVRFLFGDKRFPKISAESSEGTDGGYPVITEEDVETLNEWITSLVEHGNLQPNIRAIACKAIACRTAVVVLEAVQGNFRVTLPSPQDCAAKFEEDDPCRPVEKLLWSYEFDKEVADETGRPTTKRHLFRREWDQQNVYLYEDVELKIDGTVEWGTPRVEPHGLSFCPVLWIRNESEYAKGVDGNSILDDLHEEFEALDMALSRRHQGVIALGAPQLVEIGEEFEAAPDANGKTAGEGAGYVDKHTKHGQVQRSSARRMGPEYVWHYQGKDISVELLETSGKAFEVGTQHVNDIRSRILESIGVVLTSMADTISRVTVGAEMSARFLALAHAPLIALVQEYRHTWWPHGLRAVISMMMRMVVEQSRSGAVFMIPGTASVVPVLEKFEVEGQWVTPRMTPHWGKFFEPSATELKSGVDAAVAGRDGRVISERTAVEYASQDFGVDSVETEIEEIEEEAAEAQQLEQDRLEQERQAFHDLAAANGTDTRGNRSGGREESAADPGSVSSGAGPAQTKKRKRGRRGGKSRSQSATT
jgi:hypothetical protein